jgi:hypothetical protein
MLLSSCEVPCCVPSAMSLMEELQWQQNSCNKPQQKDVTKWMDATATVKSNDSSEFRTRQQVTKIECNSDSET